MQFSRLLIRATLVVLGSMPVLAIQAATAAEPATEAMHGPYDRLAIVNAMIIPGHGGPAYGPADIPIQGSRITHIRAFNGTTGRPKNEPLPDAVRVIDASGMYVMPGLIDLHTHIRSDELPLQYVYSMKLIHGVTTMVNGAGRGWKAALEQQRLAEANRIAAPRMFPIRDWGPSRARDPGHAPALAEIEPWHDPARVPELVPHITGIGRRTTKGCGP